MRARAQVKNKEFNPSKLWHEAETKDELISQIISKELFNVGVATSMTQMISGRFDTRPWQDLHSDAIRTWMGADEHGVCTFEIEYDDGSSEDLQICLSPEALVQSGTAAEVGLV